MLHFSVVQTMNTSATIHGVAHLKHVMYMRIKKLVKP